MTWNTVAPTIARNAVSKLQSMLGRNSERIEVRVETTGFAGARHCVAVRQFDGRSAPWVLESVAHTIEGALRSQPSPYEGQVRVTASTGGRKSVLVSKRVMVH